MIFVTVGTHRTPFRRLLTALSALPADELVVQYGHAAPPPGVPRATPFLTYQELLEHMRAARTVVSHAGVGSILCALAVGHTPVVVPRLSRYGEHVDDHQSELAEALAERREVICVLDVAELPAAVRSAPPRQEREAGGERPIHAALRQALLPVTAPSPAARR